MTVMRYSDIFFDFDDTLYDTRSNANIALRETFRDYNLSRYFVDEQSFYDDYWEVNARLWSMYNNNEISKDYLIIERFKRPLSVGIPNVTDDLCKDISDTFLAHCADKPGILPGADCLLKYLKRKGYRLHICSNGFHEIQYRKLKACGLYDYFDNIFLSEDVGYNKPSKIFYEYAVLHAKSKPRQTLMVGDNYIADVCGALDFGLDACLYRRWDKSFVPDREVTFIVDDLTEIITIL